MKRYFLFAYENYYPSGGMNDFKGDFDSLEKLYDTYKLIKNDIIEIYDTEKRDYIDIDEIIKIGLKNYVQMQ